MKSLRLDALRHAFPDLNIVGDPATLVTGITQDSRKVTKGSLFVARTGETSDGKKYIQEALNRGATAVLSDEEFDGISGLVSTDVERAVGPLAHFIYERPTSVMRSIGVTGTNGKTTITHLLRSVLDAIDTQGGLVLVGTVGCSYRDWNVPLSHTTPEADELAYLLHEAVERGATCAAMEVSSIALELGRVAGCMFEVAAFSNLTQDHLDFHETMEAYARAKKKLFGPSYAKNAVVCVDGAVGRDLAAETSLPVLTVSAVVGTKADIVPLSVEHSPRGLRAKLRTPDGDVTLESPLLGAHNLENLMVVIGCATVLKVPIHQVLDALRTATGAPGRLENVSTASDDVTVLVDYAHTPDALERVLEGCRPFTKGKLVCVFGCGGDRDPTKREPMGRAAALGADHVIVTNDNPRSEDPAAIAATVVRGVKEVGRPFDVELDRAVAIKRAILSAEPGDLIVVAGKGHETYQIIGTQKLAFDDRVIAKSVLTERREKMDSPRKT